ncbi:MAG TPA: hypothetical protein VK716_05795 [Terracidiphilus sp.]|nr:hypothetical protein [Terracidiphilus sp.]
MSKAICNAVLVCSLACLVSARSSAQVVHVAGLKPKPQMAVSSLSLSAIPASVTFHLVPNGVATGSSAVQVTTTWDGSICFFICTVNVYAYFANGNAALSGGSPIVNIPSSAVLGQVPTGIPTGFTPFTQSSPFGGAGASLQLFQQSVFLLTFGTTRTDALNLEINLSNQPAMPAGTYTGTLYIQAQSL